ncbi:hypothetical protein [Nocardia africana]|uniref:Adenylate cyclase n=1 Tax=Nocardia africana TaxID=134964 RepID=A0ABW6NB48_9NOCA
MKNIAFRILVLVAVPLVAASCGKLKSGLPIAGEIDVRHLATGQYPVEPIDTYKEYSHTFKNGSELAAMRLADNMATGLDIDPKLKFGTSAEGIEPDLDDADIAISNLSMIISRGSAQAAIHNGMMFGFSSGSSDHEPDRTGKSLSSATTLTLAVLQFPTAEVASRAAADIEQADFDSAKEKNQRVNLDKYPGAHSHWQPGIPSLGSFVAHESYVVMLFAKLPEGGAPELATFAEKAYDKQIPMLDKLKPLTPEDVVKMDPSGEGMIRRIINPNKLYGFYKESLGVLEKQGFLHFQTDREEAKKLLDTINVDRFALSDAFQTVSLNYDETGNTQAFIGKEIAKNSRGGAILYRSADEAGASKAWDRLLRAPDAQMNPKSVPDTKCAQLPDLGYYRQFSCAVKYHQYVAVVWGPQLDDAQQRAAAQFALLANSEWM